MTENKIKHINRIRQPISFEGINFGKMFPSDVDAMIEYRNKAYVIVEVKGEGAKVSAGQRIMLERLAIDTGANKDSIVLVVEHNVNNTMQPVRLEECIVRELFYSKENKWRLPKRQSLNVKDAMFDFILMIEARKYKTK